MPSLVPFLKPKKANPLQGGVQAPRGPVQPPRPNLMPAAPALNRIAQLPAAPAVQSPVGPQRVPTAPVNFPQVAKAAGLGLAHVATSVPEGVAQLADLLTPGKGANRVTQALQKFDAKIATAGKQAAIKSGDPEAYNLLQPAANVASLVGPGDIVKGADVVKAAKGAVKLAKDIPEIYKGSKLADQSGKILLKDGADAADNAKDALARSTKADAPTPIKDALIAKQAKLEGSKLPPPNMTDLTGENPLLPTKPGTQMNRFTKGAKDQRQNVGPDVQQLVQGEHEIRSTKALQDEAVATADAQPLDKTISDAHYALSVPAGKIDDKVVASTQQAIERADVEGRTQDAVDLHDKLSEHLTKQGQSIQAASLFYKLSPQGQLYKAMRDIRKAGKEITPELEAKLRKQVDDIKGAAEGDTKNYARAVFQKTVKDNIPKSKLNGVLSVWKAGLLSGAKTHTGNAASNSVFAAIKKVSDAPASAIDYALSLATGKRTKVFTTRGLASGAAEGTEKGIGTLKTGIDLRNISESGKYEGYGELNFKNPVIQKVFGQPSNLVFRALGAGDQPFFYAAAKNELHDLAIAEAKTRKLSGDAREEFVQNFVKNPTTKAAQAAKDAAEKSVLGQANKVADAISTLAQKIPAVQVLVPFIKVPTNFISRTLDFTPVGAVKGLVKVVRDGKNFDQRALAEALGEATTGTAVMFLGAELANGQKLSGAYPSDPKEQQRWEVDQITPNSVKIGDRWVSLNYLGPMGLLLNAGKEFHDATAQGNNEYVQALASFGKALTGQSFLSGLNSFANAVNDPQRYGQALVNSESGSLVPSWANDLANLFDGKQRQADTPLETIQSRIPGTQPGGRNNLAVKTDVLGNELGQREGDSVAQRIDQAINPLRPSVDTGKKNDVTTEVNRLHTKDPNNGDLQVTPTKIKNPSVEGVTVKLDDKQQYDLGNKVGQAVQKNWSALIKTPEYKALDDADKAKALSSLRTDTTTLIQRQYVLDNNLGVYKKSPSKSIQALGEGTDLSTYATKTQDGASGNGVAVAKELFKSDKDVLTKYNATSSENRKKASYSTPDYDYRVAVAKFNNDQASGKLSTAQTVRQQDELAKAKVGSTYSRDVRELYGLTKAEINHVITTDPKGQEYATKLKAYDQALKTAGVTTSLKFKNGFSTAGSGGGSGKTKFTVKSLPSIGGTKIKIPRLKYAHATLSKTKGATKKFKTAKIATSATRKLKVGTA